MQRTFLKIAKISLILVYLVIIAGAVVRMTGSGMGCPDWPKCFGYYIPPTDSSELQWKEHWEYQKNQVIIKDESLRVAKDNFKTTAIYDTSNWVPYTKHDYAIFNVWHTWIEYINRLFGALAGLATLVLAIYSLQYWKKKKLLTIASWLIVFAMGFQAWLGATVVYSVLAPVKISVHMLMALVIVAMLLYLIFKASDNTKVHPYNKKTAFLMIAALACTLIQVVLGIQVRQFIDEQIDLLGEQAKNLWLLQPTVQFYIHRSFSILVVVLNLYIAYRMYILSQKWHKINWVLALIFLEIMTGLMMYYIDFPFGSQPLHLVIASILFGVQFYLVLETNKQKLAN